MADGRDYHSEVVGCLSDAAFKAINEIMKVFLWILSFTLIVGILVFTFIIQIPWKVKLALVVVINDSCFWHDLWLEKHRPSLKVPEHKWRHYNNYLLHEYGKLK